MNFGVGYAAVPLDYRLRGDPKDPAAWGDPFPFLNIPSGEVRLNPLNYVPEPIPAPRFWNQEGIAPGQPFPLHGIGFEEWHFHLDIPAIEIHPAMLIVDAPADDLPFLGYKTFFYNACTTGPDYIENFQHGTFVFTRRPVEVYEATMIFVKGTLENKPIQQIMADMNAAYLQRYENIEPYGHHDFQ